MKNQKGITLIAMIVTIIVMLILAGVSIKMAVRNNGVIENSQKAAEKTDITESKEYILETWAYVLAKCEALNEDVKISDSENNSDYLSEFKKATKIFRNIYIKLWHWCFRK